MTSHPDSRLIFDLRRVTEKTACTAYRWIGRGKSVESDQASVETMRAAFADVDIDGTILLGESGDDRLPQFRKGERVGRPEAPFKADVAADPVEGTSYVARGQTNALAVIAVAPRGSMLDPSPAFYMEKFAAPPAAKGKIDPGWPVARKLSELAACLGKDIGALTVFVLEKPRHRALVQAIHETGARVALYPAGDVAGALMAAIPGTGIDALMGTGGTPEGIMSACAIRALGGEFLGRLDPQLQGEAKAVREAGLDTGRWHGCDELVGSDDIFFCATGITTGLMLEGVEEDMSGTLRTQTLMISGATRERQILTTYSSGEDTDDG
ncbi:MAG: class II fructose-bisphosphatase [Alphaproteobacteria bacterium]|nr:MAG: class II fructose-bisphosphatase [Alphaproteobacteria bacterium]